MNFQTGSKRDGVILTEGVIGALRKSSFKILKELDFPFDYSHEIPFGSIGKPGECCLSHL